MESTHYGELTARQTGLIRALLQDKISELIDGPSVPDPGIIKELGAILDIFGGPDGTKVQ